MIASVAVHHEGPSKSTQSAREPRDAVSSVAGHGKRGAMVFDPASFLPCVCPLCEPRVAFASGKCPSTHMVCLIQAPT